jgi:hypothetical protein
MNLEAVISALFWVALVVAASALALRGLARKYPGAALRPFGSRSEVGAYFAFARDMVRFDRRLIRYPIYVAAVTYILYLPGWLWARSSISKTLGAGLGLTALSRE